MRPANLNVIAPSIVFAMSLSAMACGGTEVTTEAQDTSQTEASPDTLDSYADAETKSEEQRDTIELTTQLCEDPSNMALLAESFTEEGGEFSFGDVNLEQAQRMLEAPTEGPFYMVNLIRYRDRAVYPDGRDTELSGREANALYAPIDFLTAIGARIVYASEALDEGGTWDDVAIVEYPCPLAFFAMSADPDFQARSLHKDAGVEESTVMVTFIQSVEASPQASPPFPSTESDPSFERVRVHRYHAEAQYPEGSEEPMRSGEEAAAQYFSAIADAQASQGIVTKARFSVQGAIIGDGQTWDDIWIDAIPSKAALEALEQSEGSVAAQHHLDAALSGVYEVFVNPVISDIPGANNEPGQEPPPLAADGTGTICQSDSDCPQEGVDTCFKPMGDTGFCSREGCDAGECGAPYVCCRDCNEDLAAMLPFKGSICLPGGQTTQLTSAPVSCTCD